MERIVGPGEIPAEDRDVTQARQGVGHAGLVARSLVLRQALLKEGPRLHVRLPDCPGHPEQSLRA